MARYVCVWSDMAHVILPYSESDSWFLKFVINSYRELFLKWREPRLRFTRCWRLKAFFKSCFCISGKNPTVTASFENNNPKLPSFGVARSWNTYLEDYRNGRTPFKTEKMKRKECFRNSSTYFWRERLMKWEKKTLPDKSVNLSRICKLDVNKNERGLLHYAPWRRLKPSDSRTFQFHTFSFTYLSGFIRLPVEQESRS